MIVLFLLGITSMNVGLGATASLYLEPTGRNRFEGTLVVKYNDTKYTVCSVGVEQDQANVLCQMAGFAGASKIYPRSQCFDETNHDESMVMLSNCDNPTNTSNYCFRLADCDCYRKRYQLGLRCYGEGALELKSNQTVDRDGVLTSGVVTVYTNGSWFMVNWRNSPTTRNFVCPTIGLLNNNKTRQQTKEYFQYGITNVTNPPYKWTCPRTGYGKFDKCNRTELDRKPSSYHILTIDCILPANNQLPNYRLCYDDQVTENQYIEPGRRHCIERDPLTTMSLPLDVERSQSQNDLKFKIPLPIVCATLIILLVVVVVWKRKVIRSRNDNGDDSDPARNDSANPMI
ncbi:uncharacterized protein [Antedon mediterranea]|uniref:uncharacterized protein isoform X2 n=1 Tax=Antedon mediterranea TaxID=105859 RepID=UPI003AF6AF57